MPNISYEHLLYNLIYEREYFFDNTDKALSNKVISEIALNVINTPNDSIHFEDKTNNGKKRKHRKKFVIDKSYCAKYGITANQMKQRVKKELMDMKIGSLYNILLPVKENLKNLKEKEVKIGKSRLYEWCKENNIPTTPPL